MSKSDPDTTKTPLPKPTMVPCPRPVIDSILGDLSSGALKAEDVATAINERAAKWYQDNGYETP